MTVKTLISLIYIYPEFNYDENFMKKKSNNFYSTFCNNSKFTFCSTSGEKVGGAL